MSQISVSAGFNVTGILCRCAVAGIRKTIVGIGSRWALLDEYVVMRLKVRQGRCNHFGPLLLLRRPFRSVVVSATTVPLASYCSLINTLDTDKGLLVVLAGRRDCSTRNRSVVAADEVFARIQFTRFKVGMSLNLLVVNLRVVISSITNVDFASAACVAHIIGITDWIGFFHNELEYPPGGSVLLN